MKIHSLGLLLCVGVTLGCGGDGVAPTPGARIEVMSGAAATDTIDATLAAPLIVLVRDSSGRPAPVGTLVRFNAMVHVGQTFETPYEVSVEGLAASGFTTFATGTTDASGRTGASVQLRGTAGTAHVIVSVPVLGIVDTVTYTVMPGAATGVAILPSDVAVTQGGSYQLQGGVVDRYGNLRPDPVTWSTTDAGVQVTSDGTLTATTVGRYTVTLHHGSLLTTGAVSVVPAGRLIAVAGSGVVLVNLDGSHLDTVAATVNPPPGDQAQWIPGTNRMVYQVNAAVIGLYTIDTAGSVARFPTTIPPTMGYASEPVPSADGQWVYFGAFDSRCSTVLTCLYRAKSDGSAAELLGNYHQQDNTPLSPAPSPDGGRVAFVTDSSGYSVIRILDVNARTLETSYTRGVDPAWSPDGQHIAYQSSTDGTLYVMNADATGARQIDPTPYSRRSITWSPDSQWLVMRNDSANAYALINVQSGLTLPLRHTNPYWTPSWIR